MQVNEKIDIQEDNPRWTILGQINDACIDLFSEYGMPLQLSNVIEQESRITFTTGLGFVALISMSNENIRLTIALQSQQDVIEQSFPSEEKVSGQQLQDWIGELSNQLAGRLKNKLLAYGCILQLGIPTVVQGENLDLDLPKRSEISQHTFVTPSGKVVILNLTTLIDSDLVLNKQETNQIEASLDEGEMMFF